MAEAIHAVAAAAVCFTRAPRALRCPECSPARAGVTVRGQCRTCSAVLQPAAATYRLEGDARSARSRVRFATPCTRCTARPDRCAARLTPSRLPPRAQVLI